MNRAPATRLNGRPGAGYNEGRSPMGGYDTRVDYKGDSYIVQTQDMGPAAQYIESLIYKSGRLLRTQRAFYTAFIEAPDIHERIKRMMEEQHKSILGQIVEGRFD